MFLRRSLLFFIKNKDMSRKDELKKQYPELNITLIDILANFDRSKTYKYLPLLCKIFSQRFKLKGIDKISDAQFMLEINSRLLQIGIGISKHTFSEKLFMVEVLDMFPMEYRETLTSFMEYMEKNLIENKDVTSYSSIAEIQQALSLVTLKLITKEMESQVIKLFEDDEWVVVRPLTFESSAKYGASTKWCTTAANSKEHFERYWRQGILVYFINKKTGYKFAGFKNLSEKNDLSFWNAEDDRVDSIDLNIPDSMYSLIREIFKSKDTNKNLCSDEIQQKVHQECIQYELKISDEIAINYTDDRFVEGGLTFTYPVNTTAPTIID